MIKFNIIDCGSQKVMENFKPADLKELPADLVEFIKRLPKGSNLKQLDKDTLQISTYKTNPINREVEIILQKNNRSGFYARLTDNANDMERYPNLYYPISVKGFKDAVKAIMEVSQKANV